MKKSIKKKEDSRFVKEQKKTICWVMFFFMCCVLGSGYILSLEFTTIK